MNFSKKTLWINIALLFALNLSTPALAKTDSFTFGHPGKTSEAARTIHITALDIRFTPTTLDVRAGETVRFIVTNKGLLIHEFVIGDAKEQASHEKEMQRMQGMPMPDEANAITLKPGETKTLIWTFSAEKAVEFACHQPGHYAAGMIGKIFVKP